MTRADRALRRGEDHGFCCCTPSFRSYEWPGPVIAAFRSAIGQQAARSERADSPGAGQPLCLADADRGHHGLARRASVRRRGQPPVIERASVRPAHLRSPEPELVEIVRNPMTSISTQFRGGPPVPYVCGQAVLDSAHTGDIVGAFGRIRRDGAGAFSGRWRRLRTLMVITGPGLIVMVGDNDAGGVATYAQAGQNYGMRLLWTLALLIPVLYVNQEMVLRLGAVSRVGHARLILERFGKFWGAFSVIDLFLLNALTIVTEFIGISLALGYLGVSKPLGVIVAAALIMVAAGTGNFRRFERFSLFLVVGSLLLVPVFLMVHPPIGQMLGDFLVPRLPQESFQEGRLSEVMLLIIAIVGTTVAPWQLFFQQSYVIDKR